MPDVTTRDIATRDVATRDVTTRDINASTASTILYQWNGTGTTATVGDDPTFPTVGDSGNNNRMEFDGSNWSYVNEDEPRFFDDKGYMAEGAATELSGRSADLTNWSAAATGSVAKDEIGLTGASSEAFTVTDSGSGDVYLRFHSTAITSGSSVYYAMFRVGYEASPSAYPALTLELSGGTAQRVGIVFNKSNGAYNTYTSTGTVSVSVARRQGTFDHWEVLLSVADNASGNTASTRYIRPCYNANGSITSDATATGSCVIASAELYKDNYSFSPILTTGGTTKTRLADTGATLPFDWSECDAEGSIEFTLTPFFVDAIPSVSGIISPRAVNPALFVHFASSVAERVAIYDGSRQEVADSVWSSAGQSVGVKVRWGGGTMRMGFDGVADDTEIYDGSFDPSGLVALFKSLSRGASIKSLTVYSEDKGDDWLTE